MCVCGEGMGGKFSGFTRDHWRAVTSASGKVTVTSDPVTPPMLRALQIGESSQQSINTFQPGGRGPGGVEVMKQSSPLLATARHY